MQDHKVPLPSRDLAAIKNALLLRPVAGKNINLRIVDADDAAFILALRLDADKGKFMSATTPDLDKQKDYNIRSRAKDDEFYFIIESKKGDPLGTVRIYDIQKDSFCWGSWMIADGAPFQASIESALLIYELAFHRMDFAQSHFDVRRANEKVRAFHCKMGAEIVGHSTLDDFFIYKRAAYEAIRPKYARFLP